MEMRSAVVLAYLELNGMGFSNRECEAQKAVMQVGEVGHNFKALSCTPAYWSLQSLYLLILLYFRFILIVDTLF